MMKHRQQGAEQAVDHRVTQVTQHLRARQKQTRNTVKTIGWFSSTQHLSNYTTVQVLNDFQITFFSHVNANIHRDVIIATCRAHTVLPENGSICRQALR